MATPSFTQSLFGGIDPYKIQRENMQQLFAPMRQAKNSYSKIGAALGTLGGMALFGMPQDPRLAKVTEIQQTVQEVMGEAPDEATFAERLPLLQQAFTEKGLIDQASIVADRIKALTPKEKSTEEQAKAAIFSISQIPPEQRTAEQNTLFNAAQAVVGGKAPQFSNPAEQALFEGFLAEANGDASQAARLMSEYKSSLRQREAAAGIPPSGEVKVTDLNTATGIVDRFTKDSKDRLSTVGRLRTLLSEAQGGSGTAVAQMRRELVKLVGDSQIGQGEVRDALGSLGIVGDVVSGINQLFTGTPSKEKLADVQRVINALESNVAKSYNSGIDRSRKVLAEGRLGKQTVERLLPPTYTPASAKKKSSFVEGKIYKDAKGNRAVYKNGKFEPIQ